MKKILITGGCGFIGCSLATYLDDIGGYEVSAIDNESLGKRAHLGDISGNFFAADIVDRDALAKAMTGMDMVVHLAADTRVMDSIANPAHNFKNNVIGTYNVLECARDAGVQRLINASTGGAILGDAPAPVHEEMVAKPLSPYGASKLSAEGYCMAFSASYGMTCSSLRFSNIYGPRSFHKGSVVAHFYKAILKEQDLVVYGDGGQIRDYLYIGDLVKGIEKALAVEKSGVYQLGTGIPTSLNDLLDVMKKIVSPRYNPTVRYEPARQGEVYATWCDISKARRDLAFAPSTGLEEGLSDAWAWFVDNYSEYSTTA